MHLSDDELRRLEELLVEQGLVTQDWLEALFASLPAAVTARLPVASAPAERLELSFDRLNEMGAVTGPVVPLEKVLEHLAHEPIAAVSSEAKRLLDNLRPRFDELRRHPGPIQAPPPGTHGAGPSGPPTMTLAMAWTDIEAQRWRCEPGGTRCPAVATVQTSGMSEAPVVEWRARRVFAGGAWKAAELTAADSGKDGVAMWRASLELEAATVRSSLLEVRARAGKDKARASRLVVPVWGLRGAVSVLVALMLFAIAWLYPLPNLGLAGGLAVAAIAVAIAVLRGRLADLSVRGPLSGVGTIERAGGVALLIAAAVVILPPILFVIVENQTRAVVSIRKTDKSTMSLSAGQGRALMSWDGDLESAEPRICVCVDDVAAEGCFCEIDSVRWVDVYNVQCRHEEWKGLGPFGAKATLTGAVSLDGAVWLATETDCAPVKKSAVSATISMGDAGLAAEGTLTVHLPWRSDLTPVVLDARTRASRLAISAPVEGGAREPWLLIDGLSTSGPVSLPAIDPAWRSLAIEIDDGALACQQPTAFGAGAVDLVQLDAPRGTAVEAKGVLSSSWKGSGPPRLCARADARVSVVTMIAPALEAGARFRVPLATRVELRAARGDAAFTASECKRPMALVEVPASWERFPVRAAPGERVESLEGDGRAPSTWMIDPVTVGNQRLALVCDPPARPVVVLGRDDVKFVLGPKELRRWSRLPGDSPVPPRDPVPMPRDPTTPTTPTDPTVHPIDPSHLPIRPDIRPDIRLRPSVCMIRASKPTSVTHRTDCPITHPDDAHVKCETINDALAARVMRSERAARRPCTSVCLCHD